MHKNVRFLVQNSILGTTRTSKTARHSIVFRASVAPSRMLFRTSDLFEDQKSHIRASRFYFRLFGLSFSAQKNWKMRYSIKKNYGYLVGSGLELVLPSTSKVESGPDVALAFSIVWFSEEASEGAVCRSSTSKNLLPKNQKLNFDRRDTPITLILIHTN